MNPSSQEIPPRSTSRAYWVCQLLGWGFYGASLVYNVRLNLDVSLVRASIEVAVLTALAIGCTHFLRRYMRARGWQRFGIAALLPRTLAASILLGLLIALLMYFTVVGDVWNAAVQNQPLSADLPYWVRTIDPLLLRTANWSTTVFLWTIVYFSVTSLRDRRAAELRQSELIRALQLSELRLLKAQLNPHFLFNCLNSVRALIADDPSGAQKAVTQLARTLRYTLRSGQDELVTLEQELEIVEDYLALESLRLGARLQIDRDIAPAARRVRIPVMLLQTIVENAIKHGIAELPRGGVLRLQAGLQGEMLMIEVENARPATVPLPQAHAGIGLRNATERLRLLYGADATFDLDLTSAERAVARIRIPSHV